MRIRKWVDMGAEVYIDLDIHEISACLSETFSQVTEDRFEDPPTIQDVNRALSSIGRFLSAMTDEHIAMLSPTTRGVVYMFLSGQAKRYQQ